MVITSGEMAAVDPAAEQLFTGLIHADERPPGHWVERRARAGSGVVVAVILSVQFAWLAAFAYAAYRVL